jgi:hypothetical protein
MNSARLFDMQVASKIAFNKQNCLYSNHRNTQQNRFTLTSQRDTTRARNQDRRDTASSRLVELRNEQEQLQIEQRAIGEKLKELKEAQKEIKASSGVKKTKNGAGRGRALPEIEDFANNPVELAPWTPPTLGPMYSMIDPMLQAEGPLRTQPAPPCQPWA